MSKLNRVFIPILGLSLSIGIITSCVWIKPVYFDDDKKLARERVEEFHKQYNGGRFVEISESFTQSQREVLSDARIVETLENNFRKSGRVLKSTQINEQLVVLGSHRLIKLQYKSVFEHGVKEEAFVLLVDGNTAKIEFYGQSE